MIGLTESLIFAASFLFSLIIIRARSGKKKDDRRYPPSFPRLPVVGSIPFIGDFVNFADFLMKKSYDLGPVFTFEIGSRIIAVLNNLEAIDDAFVRHASSFSGRETFYTDRVAVNRNGKGFIALQYGEAFTKYRRLSISILKEFGLGAKSRMEKLILFEVSQLVDHLKMLNGKAFDPKETIMISTSNVLLNILFGKKRCFNEGLSEVSLRMLKFIECFNPILEFFPIFRFIPPHRRKFAELIKHSDILMDLIQKECERINEDKTADCFVRRYIEKEGPGYDHEQLIYTLRDLTSGSQETTSIVLLWLIIYLANNPQVTERIQKEIDSVVPRDRLPTSDDREQLTYVDAVILETMRLRTPAPFAIPHLTLHDTEVLGYFIPAKTVVIANLTSAHLNRLEWPEAEVFKPERFLDEDNQLINKNRVISFSTGRRACPGEGIARHQLFLFVSGLVQNFSFLPPEGTESISDKIVSGSLEFPRHYSIRIIPRSH